MRLVERRQERAEDSCLASLIGLTRIFYSLQCNFVVCGARVCVCVCVCVCVRARVCVQLACGALRDFDALASRQTAASRRNVWAEIATPLSAQYGGDGNCDHLDIVCIEAALRRSLALSTSTQ